jgi:putative oligomerization/nucleic acid binding protein
MALIRRRPLLRAAAVGAGSYMAGKRASRDQAAPAQPAAPLPGALSPEAVEQLKSLAQLHDQGILTDQEFEQQKAKILAG